MLFVYGGDMLKKILISVIGFCVAAVIAGTQYFAHHVRISSDKAEISRSESTEMTGIVVATGLDGRVTEGVRLLITEQASRLLISGVGEGVRKSDIRRIVEQSGRVEARDLRPYIICCIDLGFEARDTEGNAIEAQAWAKTHQLNQVIVVTSDFHMPRAMIAFQKALPETTLLPHAVRTPWLSLDENGGSGWWRSPDRIRLMMSEMIKYLTRQMTASLT